MRSSTPSSDAGVESGTMPSEGWAWSAIERRLPHVAFRRTWPERRGVACDGRTGNPAMTSRSGCGGCETEAGAHRFGVGTRRMLRQRHREARAPVERARHLDPSAEQLAVAPHDVEADAAPVVRAAVGDLPIHVE